MIRESSGVTAHINNQQIQKANQPSSERRVVEQGREPREQNFVDVTSFSSEAQALTRKLFPVPGNNEQERIEQQAQDREKIQETTAKSLDIWV